MNQVSNDNYQIRNATIQDLDKIVAVHKACFKNSFSTQLGKNLLKKFYKTYLDQNPRLFFVFEDDNQIGGFCMGYLCTDRNLTKSFIKNNLFLFAMRCILLLIIFNKQAWKKVFGVFKRKKQSTSNDDNIDSIIDKATTADLLSICVLDTYRGCGVSIDLIKTFLNQLRNNGLKYCILSVDPNNNRAIRFYEKNGFALLKKGNNCLVYKTNLK